MPANVIRPIPTRPSSLPVPERPQSQTTLDTDQSESQESIEHCSNIQESLVPEQFLDS